MTWIEAIASIAGLLCVGLLVKQSIWSWPFGLIQVSLYVYIFYETRLYSDLILHVFYIFVNVYGWVHWARGGDRDSGLPVTRLTRRAMLAWSAAIVLAAIGWGLLMDRLTDAAVPYVDAFTMMASFVAQWLTARKKLESWWLWIVVDVVAVPLFATRGLHLTAGLYFVFLILCVQGAREWRRSMATSAAPAPSAAAASENPSRR